MNRHRDTIIENIVPVGSPTWLERLRRNVKVDANTAYRYRTGSGQPKISDVRSPGISRLGQELRPRQTSASASDIHLETRVYPLGTEPRATPSAIPSPGGGGPESAPARAPSVRRAGSARARRHRERDVPRLAQFTDWPALSLVAWISLDENDCRVPEDSSRRR